MEWKDEYLTWRRDKYYNVSHLRMSSDDVWLPDITLANSAQETQLMESTVVSVHYTGVVTWSGLVIVKTFCKIDFFFFPYDEQKCNLTFRPWTQKHNHVKLVNGEPPERFGAGDNGEWTVNKIESSPWMESLDHGNFSKIDVVVHLERRPLFYILNMVLPCVLIYGLTLLSFCLPGESGEKIALNVTILLSLNVFMLLSAEMMPPSSDSIPVIGQFYTATIVLVSISVVVAVISLNFFHRPPGSPRAPSWLRNLFLKNLTPVLFPLHRLCGETGGGADLRRIMDCNGDIVGPMRVPSTHYHQAPPSPKLPAAATRRLASHYESCAATQNWQAGSGNTVENSTGPAVLITCPTCNGAIKRHLGSISEDLHSMIEDKQDDDERATINDEWKNIAHAFDRLGLLLFCVATIILAVVLMSALNKMKED
ncbi:acetylcholine receptor subunit alpha-type unc-38-like [Diadema setosum]|uniref:acetylcholine receptor subunit alpha-type unc-38-like n=1 Tax=Diadema setosum TaxID=31175 RepID=UPI003B3B42E4